MSEMKTNYSQLNSQTSAMDIISDLDLLRLNKSNVHFYCSGRSGSEGVGATQQRGTAPSLGGESAAGGIWMKQQPISFSSLDTRFPIQMLKFPLLPLSSKASQSLEFSLGTRRGKSTSLPSWLLYSWGLSYWAGSSSYLQDPTREK